MIDWESSESHVFLNPRLAESERDRLEDIMSRAPELPAHVWLATSGTSGQARLVALSKNAMLASAEAANRHVVAEKKDAWLRVLPVFHVGGLAIHARAALSGARVDVAEWEPRGFIDRCRSGEIALTSLVPAQVYDLIAAHLTAPPSLRAVIVGGGHFRPDHYEAARVLGWPVLPSYGMTECCSQVATATGSLPDLRLLSHMRGRVESDGRLAFSGPSLLTGYATSEGFIDPKNDGWFVTEDVGEIAEGVVRVSGRAGDFVKIGGESVDLGRLDRILSGLVESTSGDVALVAMPDERLGVVLHLASTFDATSVVDQFNQLVAPFERIRAMHRVDRIPRTPLGKLERASLLALCRP